MNRDLCVRVKRLRRHYYRPPSAKALRDERLVVLKRLIERVFSTLIAASLKRKPCDIPQTSIAFK